MNIDWDIPCFSLTWKGPGRAQPYGAVVCVLKEGQLMFWC